MKVIRSEMKDSAIYKNVNYCDENQKKTDNDNGVYDCECQYTKQKFGVAESMTKYWLNDPFNNKQANSNVGLKKRKVDNATPPKLLKTSKYVTSTPSGICYNAGNYENFACEKDEECKEFDLDTGTCLLSKSLDKNVGWWGYCLEPDSAKFLYAKNDNYQCLAWYPIDNILGTFSINSQKNSGYIPPQTVNAGGKYYCLEGRGVSSIQKTSKEDFNIYTKKIGKWSIGYKALSPNCHFEPQREISVQYFRLTDRDPSCGRDDNCVILTFGDRA